jgi:hypothetical protein
MNFRLAGVTLWFVALIFSTGCNRSGLDLVPVEGVVMYNGSPLAGGAVMFVPTQGLPGMAVTDENGKFELKTANHSGALVGDYRVSISKTKTTAIPQKDGFPLYQTNYLVPNKYAKAPTSGLTATVVDDDNYFEFNLADK